MPTTFEFADCELDFGDYSLGGDWLIEIESDGYDFTVIDVLSCGHRQTGGVVSLVKDWVAGDLARADGKSRIRAAYEDHGFQFRNESARYRIAPPVDGSLIGWVA